MARIRSIKPELRTSITVSRWPMEVRYFFVLLWGYLDDYGRGVDDGLLIASDCFPRDRHITAETVDEWLDAMEDSGPVHRYEVDGKTFLHCPSWGEHQKPQHPGKVNLPPCPECEPDPFDEWREKHPAPRIRAHSRKPREDVMRVSAPLSGTSEGSAKGLQEVCNGSANGVVIHLPGQTTIEDFHDDETADQTVSQGILVTLSGDTTETLTPEQVYRSREQGEGDRTSAAAADVAKARPEVEEACNLLADLMVANGRAKRPNITQRWRDDIRRMIDIDGIAPEDVITAIRWSQKNSFWCSNIQSPQKLRKHYERMRLQANPSSAPLAATGTGGTSHNAGVLQRRRARREAQQ